MVKHIEFAGAANLKKRPLTLNQYLTKRDYFASRHKRDKTDLRLNKDKAWLTENPKHD